MMPPRLKSRIQVQAAIRLCDQRGIPAMVVRRGDPDAGAVYVKINRLDGTALVLNQVRGDDAVLSWMRATGPDPVADADAEAYIERQRRYDPDLWVVEVEDREGRHPFDGPVL